MSKDAPLIADAEDNQFQIAERVFDYGNIHSIKEVQGWGTVTYGDDSIAAARLSQYTWQHAGIWYECTADIDIFPLLGEFIIEILKYQNQ